MYGVENQQYCHHNQQLDTLPCFPNITVLHCNVKQLDTFPCFPKLTNLSTY